ncbi:MAG: hypothetical protein LBL59_05355 [Xanthomonadaceae bacterium]|jgi:hypothetical protein|nr:hypothetical protein [Xanthomonadaceae bacterium]
MHRRSGLLLYCFLRLSTLAPVVLAVQASGVMADTAYIPDTGDAWIDRRLDDINAYAWRYGGSFLDELNRYGGMPPDYAGALMRNHRWMPGDVYFAAMLAAELDLSYREVVRERSRHRGKSWGDIVDRLADARANDCLREIRQRIRASYRHWARPLDAPD